MNSDATNIFEVIENKFIKAREIAMLFTVKVAAHILHEQELNIQQLTNEKWLDIVNIFIKEFSGFNSDFGIISEYIELAFDVDLNHHYEYDYHFNTDSQLIIEARRFIENKLSGFKRDGQELAFRTSIRNHSKRIYQVKECLFQILSVFNYKVINQKNIEFINKPIEHSEIQLRGFEYFGRFVGATAILNEQCDKWIKMLREFQSFPEDESSVIEDKVELKWIGDKSDLAELIWVLHKSELVKDERTGKPVGQKNLAEALGALLGTNIDVRWSGLAGQ